MKRILVALDGSPQSVAALEAAAHLAGLLEAELVGVFVEDVNLLRLAGLPFARVLQVPAATAQAIDEQEMEARLAAQAAQLRRELQKTAQRRALAHSFQVLRGLVAAELLGLEADLLAMGRRSSGLWRGLGSTAETAVSQAQQPILLLGAAAALDQPVFLLVNDLQLVQPALRIAAALAEQSGELHVLFATGEAGSGLDNILAEHENLFVMYHERQALAELPELLEETAVGLLVIAGDVSDDAWQSLLQAVELPVLIVR